MRLAVFSDAVSMPTSYGRIGHYLLRGWQRRGHSTHNLALQWPGGPTKIPEGTMWNAVDPSALERTLRTLKPDVVVQIRDNWVYIARFFSPPLNPWPTVRACGGEYVSYTPVQSAPMPPEFVETISTSAKSTWVTTQWALEKLAEAGAPRDRMTAVHHGVDPATYHPLPRANRARIRRRLGVPEKGTMLLHVGLNNDRRKCQPLALLALKHYRETYDPSAFMYLHSPMIGPHYAMDCHVKALGLAGKDAVFSKPAAQAGFGGTSWSVADTEINELFAASDAYVSLTESEGFNMPAAEAACSGLPVVVTDFPVHREVLAGLPAHFVPAKQDLATIWGYEWHADSEAAADLIEKAVAGSRGPGKVPERLSWPRICAQTEKYLEALAPSELCRSGAARTAGRKRKASTTRRAIRASSR